MKLSCTPISVSGELRNGTMDLRGFVDFCAELGFDGVDLLDTQRYPWLWSDPQTDFKAAASHIKSAGLVLAAYGCGNNFAKSDRAEFAAQIEAVKTATREAAELGAPLLRTFGGNFAEPGMEPHTGTLLVKEGIEACLPTAEKSGVILGLENHGGLPGHGFELKALIDSFASPWLKCTFDCGNFIANNMLEIENPIPALEMLMPDIAHVHAKDFGPHSNPESKRRVEARVAGEGDVPLRQLTAMLEKAGYDGYYTLEYEASALVPEREGVARSYKFLRNLGLLHQALGLNPKSAKVGAKV